jgi:radical SAM-linked protein
MKYIVNFSKQGRMIYISHLDLQRLLLRTLRRVNMKPVYTQGYHPHAKFSLALPLSLGYSSDDEYFEFETDADLLSGGDEGRAAAAALNEALPGGIEIKSIEKKPDGMKKTLAALACNASYEIMAHFEAARSDEVLNAERLAAAAFGWQDRRAAHFEAASIWGNKVIFALTVHAENGNAPNPLKIFEAFCEEAGYSDALRILSVNRTEINFLTKS